MSCFLRTARLSIRHTLCGPYPVYRSAPLADHPPLMVLSSRLHLSQPSFGTIFILVDPFLSSGHSVLQDNPQPTVTLNSSVVTTLDSPFFLACQPSLATIRRTTFSESATTILPCLRDRTTHTCWAQHGLADGQDPPGNMPLRASNGAPADARRFPRWCRAGVQPNRGKFFTNIYSFSGTRVSAARAYYRAEMKHRRVYSTKLKGQAYLFICVRIVRE
ncbi:hypothetical protein PAPHI01_0047 [Pancytospora philotis]|nr:hypothetical protein PAPHI01_0047 [Pancytospora philotis]